MCIPQSILSRCKIDETLIKETSFSWTFSGARTWAVSDLFNQSQDITVRRVLLRSSAQFGLENHDCLGILIQYTVFAR